MTERTSTGKASPNEGEGSQTGARQYNDATKAFVEQGKVGPAAAEAEKAVSGPERAALEKDFAGTRPALIFGALADKNWPDICRLLAPLAAKVFAVPVASQRTADAAEVANIFRQANPQAAAAAAPNFSEAIFACKDEPFVVITGSLYLAGEVLRANGTFPA